MNEEKIECRIRCLEASVRLHERAYNTRGGRNADDLTRYAKEPQTIINAADTFYAWVMNSHEQIPPQLNDSQ